ncbi:tetratricopeptide repeat protein [Carnobacterium viridans]|uniref:Tetratricopeptide repeat-containing protein n=1 Tax=Carnobacterium viridans TaxID=174587 RepID=A0A1H0Y6R1_9LACT|nr:hydrolase [Carnobacterium viridans]SDQ10825.1 hypothetical protein SAMN04487752_0737 [Carnobacterium viridans]
MGETVPFPKNYDWYKKEAMDYFLSGRMEEAIPFFEEAYRLEQDELLNTNYTTALYQVGEYQKAKEIADDKYSFYEQEESLALFYTAILIKCHLFLQAEQAIVFRKKKFPLTDTSEENWSAVQELLEEEQTKIELEKQKKIDYLLKESYSLGNKSFTEQSAIMKELEEIPIEPFLKAVKPLLSNPYVNGIIKATAIERLAIEKVAGEFDIYWMKEKKVVRPDLLTSIKNHAIVQEVLSLLSERVEQYDPTLYQAMVQEVSLHFFVLYPFIDDVITSPVEWVELYQKRYDNSFVETTEPSLNSKRMEEWMQRIDQELMDLV